MRLNYQRIHDITRTLNDQCSPAVTEELVPDDFEQTYQMSKQEAELICQIAKSNGYMNLPDRADTEACSKVVEMMGESLHQELEGWDTDEQAIIQHYILDIMYAVSQS